MATTRKRYSGEFKAKVALAALRGDRTMNELAAEYGVHPAQIMQWKKITQEELPGIFTARRNGKEDEELKAALYQQIGQLKVELDWVKKKAGLAG
jgi:putative transposase